MDWIVEPYIPIGDPIKYSSELIVNHEEDFRRTDFISSELTSFTGYNNGTANMILTLTIKPFNVTCEIDESLLLLSPLYLAGIHIYTATWNRCNYSLILSHGIQDLSNKRSTFEHCTYACLQWFIFKPHCSVWVGE